ncbi:hypothetical protein K435DRAFT_883945 [Dendrothele bispora CBS 962.96]|uniref:Uncharacterized protein n=1 Tax=Dendrothele bispora (strain CBS 962.96) TaxID=1314807 RepID=A0A4S8MTF1_DENBC|nr:hypothetical protein K435DRAFT_883945 [Dendrothele bispora CBS 962.96]
MKSTKTRSTRVELVNTGLDEVEFKEELAMACAKSQSRQSRTDSPKIDMKSDTMNDLKDLIDEDEDLTLSYVMNLRTCHSIYVPPSHVTSLVPPNPSSFFPNLPSFPCLSNASLTSNVTPYSTPGMKPNVSVKEVAEKGGTAVFIPSIITKSEEFEEEKDEKLEREMAREKGRTWVSIRGKLKRSEKAFEAVAYLKAEWECRKLLESPWSAVRVRVGTKSSERKRWRWSWSQILRYWNWGFRVNGTDSVNYKRPVVSSDRHMTCEEEEVFRILKLDKDVTGGNVDGVIAGIYSCNERHALLAYVQVRGS